ncbi:MAG: hypothetical protein RE468_03515 [Acidithiobacillus caldus]|uniref:hypothetical protein n=1 Tax=Acidithiobacillus caldus TaxID=33059 RepID=UPI0028154294|nr:hypothetical protein [Acidithiobacillus caldus]WMT47696.1 MAG: hypothetical protein RE468_03515 [Acidithiobacillus caldus]
MPLILEDDEGDGHDAEIVAIEEDPEARGPKDAAVPAGDGLLIEGGEYGTHAAVAPLLWLRAARSSFRRTRRSSSHPV